MERDLRTCPSGASVPTRIDIRYGRILLVRQRQKSSCAQKKHRRIWTGRGREVTGLKTLGGCPETLSRKTTSQICRKQNKKNGTPEKEVLTNLVFRVILAHLQSSFAGPDGQLGSPHDFGVVLRSALQQRSLRARRKRMGRASSIVSNKRGWRSCNFPGLFLCSSPLPYRGPSARSIEEIDQVDGFFLKSP